MRIDQFLPTIAYGDAVSYDAIAISDLLKKLGFKSEIFAENIDPRLNNYLAKHINQYKKNDSDDIIIYHMSTGSDIYNMFKHLNIRKLMIYHNITPESYFELYNHKLYQLVKQGRKQLVDLKDNIDLALADSEFNRKELVDYGYRNTGVLPILIPFKDYKKEPEINILDMYNDGRTNIIFVGRIVPNKKQEDIIKTFYYYKKYIDKDSRLFLIGSYNGMEKYYGLLKKLVEILDLDDVYFTGHIRFEEILAYYHMADVFLCMSEHEGFCVPLIESMFFKVPIIAYNSTAIPYTLGDAGIMVNKKDYTLIAEMIYQVVNDTHFREQIIQRQNERLQEFSEEKVEKIFVDHLHRFLND